MTYPRFPLRINVGFLIHQTVGANRDFTFEFPLILLGSDLEVTDFQGSAHISRTQQGLLVESNFLGYVAMECVRCLEVYSQRLETHFSELYSFRHRRNAPTDLYVPDDGYIDLAPLVRDYLILEMPIKPICRPDCRGLCMYCGTNLNLATCEHQMQVMLD